MIENRQVLPSATPEEYDDPTPDFDEAELYERLRQEQIDGLNDTIAGIAMCYSPGFMLKDQA